MSGGVPPSILTHPDELTDTQVNDLLDQWVQSRMLAGWDFLLSCPEAESEWEATGINPLAGAKTGRS